MSRKCNINKLIVLILCIGMPFHSIFFAITKLDFLTIWRDLLLVLALIFILYKNKGKIKITTEGNIILVTMGICTLYAIFFHANNISSGIWINTLRIYIGAFVAYYVGCNFWDDESFIKKINILYVKTAVIVSIWGIFQMFVLGEQFLWNIEFGISSAVFANGFQRNVGVFSSANLMGVYIVFAILLLMYKNVEIKAKKAVIFFLAISLILTFSISAIIGFACCIFYQAIMKAGLKKFLKVNIGIFKKIGLALLGVGFAIILDMILLNGKVTTLVVGRIEELINVIIIMDTSRTTSASRHMRDLLISIDTVKNNFWGVGFSGTTFMLLGRIPKQFLLNAVESSIFTILFDFGIVVGIIYLLPFIYPILKGIKSGKRTDLVSDKFLIALMVLYVFLPLVSSIELRFFTFLFLGFESGKMLKRNTVVEG